MSQSNKTSDTLKSTETPLAETRAPEKTPSLDEPLIPKTQEIIPQNFYTPQRGIQEERVAKFFDVAIDDIATFVRRTIGTSYEPKNNFSFTQKQKVMGYIYYKNNEDLAKSRMFTYLDVKAGATKESMQKRIDHLNEMKDYNRSFFIYNLAKCQNRLRTIGYIWGSVASCIVWNTFMKNSSHLRKLAVSAFLIHAAGQIASYRTMDRVFDGIYPLFFKDFSEHINKEIKEGEDSLFQDTFKDHEITQMIKEQVYNPQRAMKKIEEKTLYNEDI